MGLYIKGMEMPTTCGKCKIKSIIECDRWKRVRSVVLDRHRDCPLVPVPEHGIIDREQILNAIRLELAQTNAANDMDDYDEWMHIFDYVRKYPTIIPAEPEEEETK